MRNEIANHGHGKERVAWGVGLLLSVAAFAAATEPQPAT